VERGLAVARKAGRTKENETGADVVPIELRTEKEAYGGERRKKGKVGLRPVKNKAKGKGAAVRKQHAFPVPCTKTLQDPKNQVVLARAVLE